MKKKAKQVTFFSTMTKADRVIGKRFAESFMKGVAAGSGDSLRGITKLFKEMSALEFLISLGPLAAAVADPKAIEKLILFTRSQTDSNPNNTKR